MGDLRAERKYIHRTFQGLSDLIRCLFPGEAKDTEEAAALCGVSKQGRGEPSGPAGARGRQPFCPLKQAHGDSSHTDFISSRL